MRGALLPVLLLTMLVVGPSAAVGADDADGTKILLLAAPDGADAVAAAELFAGARIAAEYALPGKSPPKVTFVPASLAVGDATALAKSFTAWRKDGVALVLAHVPHGSTANVEAAAQKAKLPLLVVSPEPTRPDLDPQRAVFWAGGVPPQDEALQAMDYLIQPLGSKRPAILHDGSPRGLACVKACEFFTHVSQTPGTPVEVGGAFDGKAAASLVADGADGVVYFGGPDGANRVLAALAAAEAKVPVLLGQGLASAAVPRFHSGEAKNAWAIEARWLEDRGRQGKDDRYPLVDALAKTGAEVLSGHERGHRTMIWIRRALETWDGKPKTFVATLRALDREAAAGKPVFQPYGHASLARLELWKSEPSKIERLGPCHRRPETRVPVQGIPHVGFYSAKKFKWEPGTHHVWVRWRKDEMNTIANDMYVIGLNTKGYEADLEDRVLDDLMGRALSKLNRLFLRNPDGTSIPGVSHRISFTTDPPSKDVRASRQWDMLIGGDDPVAGGRAGGKTAWVFSTFIQRTLYIQHKLTPPMSATDRQHMLGGYAWDSSADENIRNGAVRALVDGFSQALALTGAHELGHLAGCGHDTEAARSLMNVASGAGLDFEWADWIPKHVKILEKRLSRMPAEK